MRLIFTLLVFLIFSVSGYAQPSNDDCDNATPIGLSTPPSCPAGGSVNTVINSTNIDATPTTPYPTFSGCNPGGNTTGPAAEVWYSFTATGNTTTFTITGGLSTPNIVVFTGGNCQFLTAIACARGMPGTNVVTLDEVNLTPGQTYYLLISGGDLNDQGDFTLTVESENDCSLCTSENGQFVTVNPPPANGTYASGTQVQFCYTISDWDLTGTVEWFHGLQITLGSGWDEFSLIPDWANTSAGSCPANPGSWVWTDFWTSCATGNDFGPGFAYDGTTGVGCGGGAQDGDPGNNWGYGGGGCENISSSTALTFCWYITVLDCPPNDNGADLSVIIEPLSDGESGNWNQVGCNSGVSYDFLASATCCDDPDPIATSTPTSCPGAADGTITFLGGAGIVSGPWNYTVFDAAGGVIYQSNGVPGQETLGGLPAGMYNVLAVNALSGCSRSTFVTIDDGFPPTALATGDMPCPGDAIQLMGDVIPGGADVQYLWTGPSGATYSNQNPQVFLEGEYTLEVTVDGCPAVPASVVVGYVPVSTSAQGNPVEVCTGDLITLSATGGDFYDWGAAGVGQTIQVLAPDVLGTQVVTYTVDIQTAEGCTATETVDILVHQLPEIEIVGPLEACEGAIVTLNAVGGVTYDWTTPEGPQSGSVVGATIGTGPVAEFSVTATDQFGCVGEDDHFINVNAPPTVSASAMPDVVCAGEEVTLSATGGDFYDWQGESPGQTITVNPTSSTIYEVVVTDANGCQNTASVSVVVESPIEAPEISCGNITPNSVVFEWNPVAGATGYDVTVNNGPMGTLNGTSYTVNGLSPGQAVTITVAALSSNSCPDATAQFTCTSQDCVPVDVTASGVATHCLDGSNLPDTLSVTIAGAMMDGDTSWSGPGIIDTLLGIFDPAVADTGFHEIIVAYQEGDCVFLDTMTIEVYLTPSADFAFSSDTICLGDTLMINYTGSADTSANYTWNFNGGMADPGSGQGPQSVSWNTSGNKIVALTVTENGCPSEVYLDTVTVLAPLTPPVVSCGQTSTTSVEFVWNDVVGAAGYDVTVLTGQTGMLNGTSFLVENLMPEDTVTIEVTAIDAGPCSDVSTVFTCIADPCPDYIISITSIADICLDGSNAPDTLSVNVNGGTGNGSGIWAGTGIVNDTLGVFDPIMAGAGSHEIIYTYTEGPCSGSDTLMVNIFDTPTADFTLSETTICINDTITITYAGTADAAANYTWTFNGGLADPGTGVGPHEVSWNTAGDKTISLIVEENGCTSEVFTQNVTVENPMAAPVINCNTTTSSIEFTWMDVNGAVDYMITVIQGPAGVQTGNSYLVTGLSPGDVSEIQVEAIGTGPCGNSMATASCIAEDCPMVSVSIDSVAPICLDASVMSIQLNAVLMGDNGMGTGTWSGTGITDMALGTFDPTIPVPGITLVTYTYQEGNCSYSASREIVINEQPTATFTVDDSICINSTSTITYTGSAGQGADYSWDFGGGSADPGTGAGPHEVSWPDGGDKTVSLTVTENDCASEEVSLQVFVDTLLAEPVITCDPTTFSIEFSWMDVAGAVDYVVTVLQGPSGTQTGNTYLVEGLDPGEMVEIQIEAIGTGPCGNSISSMSCVAADCPMVEVSIDSVPPICLDANVMNIVLTATLNGDNGMGTGTWSGIGVIDPVLGTFDPTIPASSPVSVTYTYQENNCTYTASRDIVLNEQPTADFTVEDNICLDQIATAAYTGSASIDATYSWDFDGANVNPGTGAGPHQLSWDMPGTYTISLTVTENECASELFTQTVQVDEPLIPPVIDCETDNTSIIFSWDPVAGATGYEVIDVTGPAGTLSGTTYSITGLNPGDEVTIQVIAQNDSPCGDVMSSQTCIAQDCPEVTIEIDPIDDLCEDGMPVSLSATAMGGDGSGTYTWTGPGVVGDTYDPSTVPPGTYTINVEYVEGVCIFNENTMVTVNAVPDASFTVESPICLDNTATVTYTGGAAFDADYNWSFDGGMANPGTGQGPHELSWTAAGSYNISLIVVENGCSSEGVSQSVEVEAPLEAPMINCETTSSSILFTWDAVAGATDYQVVVLQGASGTLSGTTYLVEGLAPGDAVEIEVIAIGDGACGNSSNTANCIAQDCPPLTAMLSGPSLICSGDNANISLEITSDNSGPYTVVYSLNGDTFTDEFPLGSTDIVVALDESTDIEIVSITNIQLSDCMYGGNNTLSITVEEPQSAGIPATANELCEALDSLFDLNALLTGASIGGVWTETSTTPSTGGAFNSTAGTFSALNQQAGTYSFTYTVGAGGVCPTDEATVEITIHPLPIAAAGDDMELTCNMGMVTLGSNASTGVSYLWTAGDTIIITDPTNQFIDVGQPGTYQLTATSSFGCTSTDEVSVDANLEVPTFETALSEISCFEAEDGAITLSNFNGGQAPYQVSFNGGAFADQTQFFNLTANSYDIVVQDANGCISQVMLDMQQPDEVVVTLTTNLEGENVIQLGDSILLSAVYNPGLSLDTIMWQPDSIGFDSNNASSAWVSPAITSSFSVTIMDDNGCSDSDNITVIVEKNRPVFVPNVFSPNDDGRNDIFYIHGGAGIVEVKKFSIFSRWGEELFSADNFQPNDPDYGWDGTHRGKLMDASVFVYYAEIEFEDGEVILFKGDVTLLR